MVEISIVPMEEIDKALRWDAEYFQPYRTFAKVK
jgi:hypothetical protein